MRRAKIPVPRLARELGVDVHGKMELRVRHSWRIEIRRRIEEMESGKVKGIPLKIALARARKAAGL